MKSIHKEKMKQEISKQGIIENIQDFLIKYDICECEVDINMVLEFFYYANYEEVIEYASHTVHNKIINTLNDLNSDVTNFEDSSKDMVINDYKYIMKIYNNYDYYTEAFFNLNYISDGDVLSSKNNFKKYIDKYKQ